MPRICHRLISEPRPVTRPGPTGFTLIEALVALAITALIATTAAMLATSALERERRARLDAAAARAIQSLTAQIADPEASLADPVSLPDGWTAVLQRNPDLPDWQSWEIHSPDAGPPYHILHVPVRDPPR